MKLLNLSIQNFGSYEKLQFEYSTSSLALLSGTTGAGKSTIADAPCWVLFGYTAKDGNSEDVRRWGSDNPTTGTLIISIGPSKSISITRVRGKSKQNDLYFEENGNGVLVRGKDITDTQRLLNEKLGFSYDTYIAACYFHEFSATGSFFTAKAQQRRSVFEKIANLDLPVKLAETCSEHRKVAKKELEKLENGILRLSSELKQMRRTLSDSEERKEDHDKKQAAFITELEHKFSNFSLNKDFKRQELEKKIQSLSSFKSYRNEIENMEARLSSMPSPKVCKECGQLKNEADKSLIKQCISELKAKEASEAQKSAQKENAVAQLAQLEDEPNLYGEQLRREQAKTNPFSPQIIRVLRDMGTSEKELRSKEAQKKEAEARISSLSHLYDLSFELRGQLLLKVVSQIEKRTNECLDKYFDSEIKVGFTLEGADSLAVSIQKSGNECVYKQLSRGQRALLRLGFSVAVMEASANKSGTYFNVLFFDEVLDGLSTELKIKAYGLFEELSKNRDSVFIIDHAEEFKNLFDNKYHVSIAGDKSEVVCDI